MPSFDQSLLDATAMQPLAPNRPAIQLPDTFAAEQPAEQSAEQLAETYASLPVESMVDMEICTMVVNRKRSSEDARRTKKDHLG